MLMNKEFKVPTITEFLNLISRNNYNHYIFRGQNEAFESIQASEFRPYISGIII